MLRIQWNKLGFCRPGAFASVLMAVAALLAADPAGAAADVAPDSIDPNYVNVTLDQATLIKLPERAATVVIGNPLIADIAIQPGGLVVVTGNSYGVTNMVALDRVGAVLMEKFIDVRGPLERSALVVYNGARRVTYYCAPECLPRIMLGDTPVAFDSPSPLTEALGRTGAAQSLSQPPSANKKEK
jgi:hypothetical protein